MAFKIAFRGFCIFEAINTYDMPSNKPKKPVAKKPNPTVLKEVKITAKRPAKKLVEPTSQLFPKGEVSNRRVDSLVKAQPRLKSFIGSPQGKDGQKKKYSPEGSDIIKKALKIKG